jgi:hypothetical protein
MTDHFYRTGDVAQQLGISPYTLRCLCEFGLVEARQSPSGQWKVPGAELARLKREGIPPLPSAAPDEPRVLRQAQAQTGTQVSPRTDPNVSLMVAKSAAKVLVKRDDLECRQLDVEFKSIDRTLRDQDERDARRRAEAGLATRRAKEESESARKRTNWENYWLGVVEKSMKKCTPAEGKRIMLDATARVLKRLQPERPDEVIGPLIIAEIEEAMEPYFRRGNIAIIIAAAVNRLPAAAKGTTQRSAWQVQAAAAAQQAVRRLDDSASLEEVRLAAEEAVDEVLREFDHEQIRRKVIDTFELRGATQEDRKDATGLVCQALAEVRVGTTEYQMRQLAEAALESIRDRISRREDAAVRQEVLRVSYSHLRLPVRLWEPALEAARIALDQAPAAAPRKALEEVRDSAIQPFLAALARAQKKKELIQSALSEVYEYLRSRCDSVYGLSAAFNRSRELSPLVEARLNEELTGDESPNAAKRRARKLTIELDAADRE